MYDNLTRTNLEFAHREAEKRIADLEKENANLKALRKYELNVAKLEIEKLEKENTELKARLNAINQLIPELEKMFDDLLISNIRKKMTDEELTGEYAEVLCQTCAIKESLKQAHLDGLKAGKGMNISTKWHKVAHGDLPSEEGGWVCNQNGLPCFFDWGTEQWLDCEGTQIRTTEWCHMPHKE